MVRVTNTTVCNLISRLLWTVPKGMRFAWNPEISVRNRHPPPHGADASRDSRHLVASHATSGRLPGASPRRSPLKCSELPAPPSLRQMWTRRGRMIFGRAPLPANDRLKTTPTSKFPGAPSRTRTDTVRILRRRVRAFATSGNAPPKRSYRLQDNAFMRCRYASGSAPIRPRIAPGRRDDAGTRLGRRY